MSIPVDDRFVSAQVSLMRQRDYLLSQKRYLLDEFKTFAARKVKTCGKPFRIEFRSINGDKEKYYSDLKIGEEFFLECGSFIYNPTMSLLENYERIEVRTTKTADDFDEFTRTTTSKPRVYRKLQQKLELATKIEREQIEIAMKKRIDKILVGIFKNELSFDDPEFKKLVDRTVAIENDLKELNIRISALYMVNATSGIDMNAVIARSNRETEIINVLKELDDKPGKTTGIKGK